MAGTILDFADLTMEEAEDSLSLKKILTGETDTLREVQISGLDEGPNIRANGGWLLAP